MSWWSDKLSGAKPVSHVPPAPMYTPSPPVTQPAAPVSQQPQTYTDPNTGQTFLLVPAQQQDPHQPLPDGHGKTVAAANQWHGGAGVQDARGCPNCHGTNYFSRVDPTAPPSRNGPPMPQCFDCGYPLTQFGSKSGAGGSQQAVQAPGRGGPPRHAREAPAMQEAAFHGNAQVDGVVARVG